MKTKQAVVALVLSVAPVLYPSPTVPTELSRAVKARDVAIDKVDVAAWERLTAAEFTVVNESGHFMTHAERLAELRKAKPNATPSECAQQKVTMFANGTAAVRRCLAAGVWWTDVWTKTSVGWQAIAVQGTVAAK